MNTLRISTLSFILFSLVTLPLVAQQDSGKETKKTSLFDGKTYAGWEGDTDKSFRITEGAIVSGTLKERIPRNEFLCTEKSYRNFILTVEFKLVGAGANAGIQFRTERIPDHHEVIGYQADMGQRYWGALYDESRRRKILAGPELKDVMAVVKENDWNEYVIHAEGDRIQLWINGFKTVDYLEPDADIPQDGKICLQIHGGPPSEAWYRNLQIRELP